MRMPGRLGRANGHALAMRMLMPVFALALLWPTTSASAQTARREHATITLLAESDFAAGKPGWIGLLFDLEPGWHIYWVNQIGRAHV